MKCMEGYHKQKLLSDNFYDVVSYIKYHDTEAMKRLSQKSRMEKLFERIEMEEGANCVWGACLRREVQAWSFIRGEIHIQDGLCYYKICKRESRIPIQPFTYKTRILDYKWESRISIYPAKCKIV